MEAFSRIKYVRFDGDNFSEISSMLKTEPAKFVLSCGEREVATPEWKDNGVTVPVIDITVINYNNGDPKQGEVVETLHCVQGNYVCYSPTEDKVFVLTHKEFVKKYEVEDEEPVTGTNFPFQDCNNCIYKKLYEYPKLPPTPSDPPYPWNQTQIWCKTQGETK